MGMIDVKRNTFQKIISNLKCSYLKKYEIKSHKIFTVVKIFHCRKNIHLETLFNYNSVIVVNFQ